MGASCSSSDPNDPTIRSNLKSMSPDQMRVRYETAGQGHVFELYNDLDAEMRQHLEQQANQFDPMQVNQLFESLVLNSAAKEGEEAKGKSEMFRTNNSRCLCNNLLRETSRII